MNNKQLMLSFIKAIKNKGLLTSFIASIFDYNNFHDYNYLFRMTTNANLIIIDIYDNISSNRFNRYIFSFDEAGEYDIKIVNENNVFVTRIYINRVEDSENKLIKLAYLFQIEQNKMLAYANTFLDKKYVNILNKIINKSINL